MEKYIEESVESLAKKIKSKEYLCIDVVSAFLDKIEKENHLNAVLYYDRESALNLAKESDERIKNGTAREFEGVPIIVKDNISTKELKTTCASKFLENYEAPYNATVINKLQSAGFIVIGKANMDEFAMGGSGENSAFGKTLNPINNDYVTGGSSSGSVASVAGHLAPVSLGTDTGGSIRQPSGFCGVVGIKPTYGRVSRYGVVAFASSLDQVGPVTNNVRDNALVLDVISGYDPADDTTEKRSDKKFSESFVDSIAGMKIGVAKEYFSLGMNEEVKSAIQQTINFYKENGAEIVDISLPHIDKSLAVYYILSSAEAASNLSRFDGIKYTTRAKDYDGLTDLYYKSRTQGFGAEVKRRIMMGNFVLSASYYDAYYRKAQRVQNILKKEFEEAFKKVDAIISPTSPTTAFKFGSKATPLDMYLADIYTVPVNIVGVPAISFPVSKSEEGLPIGCQLIANKWNEGVLYALSEYYERKTRRED